jgi:hypothetical protein
MRYSQNATSQDDDISSSALDLYAYSNETGNYPAVVYEHFSSINSHLILSGEAIYSDYKYMYDQRTENGVFGGGYHQGQVLVNNILNYFLEDRGLPTPTPTPTESETPEPTEVKTIGYDLLTTITVSSSVFVLLTILRRKRR